MRDALDIRVRSLQKKGEGSYSSKSNSIRQSVSKEGNWLCIRLKYYPIRGRWKNREKSLPKRGRINLEAATRRIHTLIDETNPRNFRLCYSHVKDRSWFVPFIRGTTILFLLPFPPFPRFVSTRVRWSALAARRYKPNKLFVSRWRGWVARIGPIDTNRKVAREWREKIWFARNSLPGRTNFNDDKRLSNVFFQKLF